jgi:hypothetical protein
LRKTRKLRRKMLRLKIEPAADCGRYDGIRKIA